MYRVSPWELVAATKKQAGCSIIDRAFVGPVKGG